MNILRWIDEKISVAESFALVLILSSLIGLYFLQIVLRNFFNSGIVWMDQLLRYLVVWVLFLGSSQATRLKKHLTIDAMSNAFSERGKALTSIFINLFSFVITVVLAKGGWDYVLFLQGEGTLLVLDIKLWVFQLMIPLGMSIVGFRFILNALESLSFIRKGESA